MRDVLISARPGPVRPSARPARLVIANTRAALMSQKNNFDLNKTILYWLRFPFTLLWDFDWVGVALQASGTGHWSI